MHAAEDAADRWIFGLFLRLFGVVLFVTLFDSSRSITAWCGERGVFPLRKLKETQRMFYPSVMSRLVYWPSAWFPFSSNTALRVATVGASLCALVYALTGHAALLFASGAVLLMLYEPCSLQWPWHNLSSELWWILVIASGGNYTSLQPLYQSVESVENPSFALLFALRFLLFRVVFGFGKLKFSGSTMQDRMYVRPFSAMLPILSTIGLSGYRYTPRWLFQLSYVGFFLGEIIAPFAYFLPQPYRSWAAVNTMLLMLGIQISGNFGTFNALTALLSSSLLVAGGGPQLVDLASPVTLALCAHVASGLCLIPFNSWVSASWFFWPTLRRALPKATRYFEFLSLWRISNGYGVFPPNVMSTYRQIPVYQVSNDGSNWASLRYRYQPSRETDQAHFIPLLHPILDFVSFYYCGYGGFIKTLFDMRSPCPNLRCRPINAVARNLLQDGDAKLLFAQESTDLLSKRPPKFVRVLQQCMIPLELDEWLAKGKTAEWKIIGGTIELPCVSLADIDGPWLPSPYVSSLDETDPSMTVWRRRSQPYQDSLRRLSSSSASLLDASFQSQVEELLHKGSASSYNCNAAADFHDELVLRHGSAAMNRLLCAVQRAAYGRLQMLEDRFFFTSSDSFPPPPDQFDLYLTALSRVVNRSKSILAEENGQESEAELQIGMFVFTFLFSAILRVEASVYRRMVNARCTVEKIDPEGDKIPPAGLRIVRQLARSLRFPQVEETLHEFAFNHGTLEFDFVGKAVAVWPWAPPH